MSLASLLLFPDDATSMDGSTATELAGASFCSPCLPELMLVLPCPGC